MPEGKRVGKQENFIGLVASEGQVFTVPLSSLGCLEPVTVPLTTSFDYKLHNWKWDPPRFRFNKPFSRHDERNNDQKLRIAWVKLILEYSPCLKFI